MNGSDRKAFVQNCIRERKRLGSLPEGLRTNSDKSKSLVSPTPVVNECTQIDSDSEEKPASGFTNPVVSMWTENSVKQRKRYLSEQSGSRHQQCVLKHTRLELKGVSEKTRERKLKSRLLFSVSPMPKSGD